MFSLSIKCREDSEFTMDGIDRYDFVPCVAQGLSMPSQTVPF